MDTDQSYYNIISRDIQYKEEDAATYLCVISNLMIILP
jgi:hypothetical protein